MLRCSERRGARTISVATALGVSLLLAGCAGNQALNYTRSPLLTLAAEPGKEEDGSAPAKGTMTLAQVARHTVANNPDIGIARAQDDDAKAGVGVALAQLGPTVTYSADTGPEHTFATDTEISTDARRTDASVTLSQPIFDFGKTISDVSRANALKQSSDFRRDAKTLDVLYDTVTAYLAVLELDKQIANSQANVAAHKKMYSIVELNEQGGNGTTADLQKAQTRLDAAKSEVLDFQAQRRTAASQFERVTGWAPGALQTPSPAPSKRMASTQDAGDYEGTDPLLLSYKQDKLSLEAQINALAAGYLPQVSLDVSAHIQQNVSGVNPITTSQRAMFSLQGTLFDSGDKIAKITQLRARIRETDYRYQRTLDNLTFDLGDADRVLSTAGDKLSNIAARIASGQKVVDLYTQQFEAGTRTVFELLDAQQELSAARAEQITAKFDVMRAKYHQLRLTGELGDVLGN